MTEAFDEVRLTLNHSKVMLVANNEWLVSVITSLSVVVTVLSARSSRLTEMSISISITC